MLDISKFGLACNRLNLIRSALRNEHADQATTDYDDGYEEAHKPSAQFANVFPQLLNTFLEHLPGASEE